MSKRLKKIIKKRKYYKRARPVSFSNVRIIAISLSVLSLGMVIAVGGLVFETKNILPTKNNHAEQIVPAGKTISTIDPTDVYISTSGHISFKYYDNWKLSLDNSIVDSYGHIGTIIIIQGPKQVAKIYDGVIPNYHLVNFKVTPTVVIIGGNLFQARKFTSIRYGGFFIDVKIQEKPYKLYIQYGDAADASFQGYEQQYRDVVSISSDIIPLNRILQTFVYK